MVSTLRQYGGGEHVATMSNLNPSFLELLWVKLSWVELGLGFDNIKVIGPEEMPILVWGQRKRPPTKMGST